MIPIHIVTGFLGSGKTTFIKKMLLSEEGKKTIVLINELGEVGIDDRVVQAIHDNTYLMPSGCLCCAVLNDIKETLLSVLKARNEGKIPYFTQILIETTGLANPASVLKTIKQDVHLKGLFFVQGLTTLVDSENAALQSQLHPEWSAQVVAAQQVLLSKTDRITTDKIETLKQNILSLYPHAQMQETHRISNIKELFLSTEQLQVKNSELHFFLPREQQKHFEAQSFIIEYTEKLDWMKIGLWFSLLLKKYGERILRVKGFLNLIDSEEPVLIQCVQHCMYPPEHVAEWPWNDQSSKLVFIVRDLDASLIKRSFEAFMKKAL